MTVFDIASALSMVLSLFCVDESEPLWSDQTRMSVANLTVISSSSAGLHCIASHPVVECFHISWASRAIAARRLSRMTPKPSVSRSFLFVY